LCQQFTEITTHKRLSLVLAELLLVGSLIFICLGLVILWIINWAEKPPVSNGSISRYDFDFNEHQNYWEADNR
jgi:hypothetical protein